jgi:hypothetical protein
MRCGIRANSKSFLLSRSHRAERVGRAGDTADYFDRNVRSDSDLIRGVAISTALNCGTAMVRE